MKDVIGHTHLSVMYIVGMNTIEFPHHYPVCHVVVSSFDCTTTSPMTSLERAMSEDAEDLDVLEERRAIAAAAERRLRTTIPDHERLAFDAEHDLRQSFRRLVNPGIIRPNSRETASTALEV